MDAVSYSHSAKQAQRIEKFIKNPDSNSGIVTVPKVIGAGENVTIPAGRVAVLPNIQVNGTLNVEGEVFIPAGTTLDKVVEVTGNQNIDGIKTFSSSPIVPTPTTGTQAVNKDYADLKVALAQFTGANQFLSRIGYQKLPGGLIVQWGLSPESSSSGEAMCWLPITFPTALVSLTHSVAGTSNSSISTITNQGLYAFTFSIRDSVTGSRIGGQAIYYLAIGY